MNIILPKVDNNDVNSITRHLLDYRPDFRNIYVVGGNGAGKSRLGMYIENNLKEQGIRVIRIAAQKVLSIPPETFVRSVESIEYELQTNQNRLLNFHAYNNPNHVTTIVNDFNQVLAKLFSLKANRDAKFIEDYQNYHIITHPSLTPIEIIGIVWRDIFPQRQLHFRDSRIEATYQSPLGYISTYSANDMSDGERGALYLLAHALTAPDNSVIIFDEPESHLHKSILTRVWDKLEEYCPNKRIIAITHDLDLVATRRNSYKLWIKEYHGENNWNWEYIPNNTGIPEALFLEILGSRKKILFVEGKENGDDQNIFQHVYPDYLVVPCESCEKVIHMTKSINNNSFWKTYKSPNFSAKGLIDRDIKNDSDITYLKGKDIEVMNVAELENLLCVPDVFNIVCEVLQFNNFPEKINEAEKVIRKYLSNHLMNEAFTRLKKEIDEKLKKLNALDVTNYNSKFNSTLKSIDTGSRLHELRNHYNNILEQSDLSIILKDFNNKGIIKQLNHVFSGTDYQALVIRLITTQNLYKDRIVEALRSNLPSL